MRDARRLLPFVVALVLSAALGGCGSSRQCMPCRYSVMPYYYEPAYRSCYVRPTADCYTPRYCEPYCPPR